MLDNRLDLLPRRVREPWPRRWTSSASPCQIVCAIEDDDAVQHPGMAMFNPQLGFTGDVENATARARELMDKGVTDFNVIVPPGARAGARGLEKMPR